ncbi:chorismate synthase [Dehalococcoidia bacterium]|nr:chorismate synthase [Dehalococcoidia bacterium]
MFRFLTAGESHGKGLVVVVEGFPAGISLSEADIALHLKRRQGGYGRGARMQIERDHAEILSGVRHGLTIGSPISLLIQNRDWQNWQEVMSVVPVEEPVLSGVEGTIDPVTRLRPGHADLAGIAKYNLDDIRPILERASARETAARVAAGAVARKFLQEFDIEIHSHVIAIGGCRGQAQGPSGSIDWEKVEASPVRCADAVAERRMIAAIGAAREAGDSVGGLFEVIAIGVPIGLGSHIQWDRRLDGRIAQAMMSIHAVKGVEIGAGFALADLRGSEAQDVIEPGLRRPTNRAGGIEGGMTNGQPLVVRAAVKPIATIAKPLASVDLRTGEKVLAHFERADICIVPAAGIIGEAMLAIVLAGAFLEKFGGDHIEETSRNYRGYREQVSARFG